VAAARHGPWSPLLPTCGDNRAGPGWRALRASCLSRQPRWGGLVSTVFKKTIKVEQISVFHFRIPLNQGPILGRPPLKSALRAQNVEETSLSTGRAPTDSWNLPDFLLPAGLAEPPAPSSFLGPTFLQLLPLLFRPAEGDNRISEGFCAMSALSPIVVGTMLMVI
jgi:hypothetical protein